MQIITPILTNDGACSLVSEETVNQVGLLEYDCQLSTSKRSVVPFKDDVQITVCIPARVLKQEKIAFSKPHASMKVEADEHYALLVDLQKMDSQFDDILYEYR